MSIANPGMSGDRAQSVIAAARIIMGLCLMYFGISKFWFVDGTIAFVATKLPMAAFVFWLSVVIETGGGLLMVLGVKTRWVAAWFAFYLCFTAVVFHTNFANRGIMDHFFENIALAGGFLYMMAVGPGAAALDNRSRD